MENYKQIKNTTNYFINNDGTSIIKLCRPELYSVINGKPFRRTHTYRKFNIALDENIYIIIDNLVYRKIKICDNGIGYKVIKINGKSSYVHRLVYETFVGVIPSDKEINHIDHNKDNNFYKNLELVTHSENMMKQILHSGNKLAPRCKCCGKKIYSKVNSWKYCKKCSEDLGIKREYDNIKNSNYKNRKVLNRPSKKNLWKLITSKSFLEISRMYGVSDNAVRKWCRYYNLPFRKKDIEQRKNELEI